MIALVLNFGGLTAQIKKEFKKQPIPKGLKSFFNKFAWVEDEQLEGKTVLPFCISKKEITNADYREFVSWVQDSVAHAQMGHTEEYPHGIKGIDWEQELNWERGAGLDFFFTVNKETNQRHLITEYLVYKAPEGALNIYPDTALWGKKLEENATCTNYFTDPCFDNFPVVGLSVAQAQAYCHWLGFRLSEKGMNVRAFLPRAEEWLCAANAPVDIKLTDCVQKKMLKCKEYTKLPITLSAIGLEMEGLDPSHQHILAPSPQKEINALGIFDMVGNVSEWVTTAEETIAILAYREADQTVKSKKIKMPNTSQKAFIGFRICLR